MEEYIFRTPYVQRYGPWVSGINDVSGRNIGTCLKKEYQGHFIELAGVGNKNMGSLP